MQLAQNILTALRSVSPMRYYAPSQRLTITYASFPMSVSFKKGIMLVNFVPFIVQLIVRMTKHGVQVKEMKWDVSNPINA